MTSGVWKCSGNSQYDQPFVEGQRTHNKVTRANHDEVPTRKLVPQNLKLDTEWLGVKTYVPLYSETVPSRDRKHVVEHPRFW